MLGIKRRRRDDHLSGHFKDHRNASSSSGCRFINRFLGGSLSMKEPTPEMRKARFENGKENELCKHCKVADVDSRNNNKRKPRAYNPAVLRASASKKRDRKETLMRDSPMHSDAQKGFDSIISLGHDAYNRQMGIVLEAENDSEEAENYLEDARNEVEN